MNNDQDLKEGSMEEILDHLKAAYDDEQARVQIGFDIAELKAINLAPGDVLSVKLIGDDFSQEVVESLRNHLKPIFPNNKVMVFTMPANSDIIFEVIKAQAPANYCENCNCGKKEQSEGQTND